MKKHIILLAAALAVADYAQAQQTYANDGLRFSQTNYGSSARFKAMGNAQIGVGGDISSLGGNPAGLGLFTKSEFVFTPEFNNTTANGYFLDQNSSTNKGQVNVSQIGTVFFMPTYKASGQDAQKGVVSAVIGIGYNRNNDYGYAGSFSGLNTQSSVKDMFGNNSTAPNSNQFVNLNRSGSVSEFNIAGALNISNEIYIGASLGLVNLNYNFSKRVEEDGLTVGSEYYLDYNESQATKGSGVNARFGILFRPTPELRVGLNLQTPTWYNIDEAYSETSNDAGLNTVGDSNFSYNLSTPLKGSLGASYVIANKALISADVDYVDYSSIKFKSADGGNLSVLNTDNNFVKANYQGAVNFRVGGEVKMNDLFSLRAGYGLNGTAFKDDTDDYFATKFYSGGLGYRNQNYYLDLTYQRVDTHSTFDPYYLANGSQPVIDSKNNKNNVFLTFGVRF